MELAFVLPRQVGGRLSSSTRHPHRGIKQAVGTTCFCHVQEGILWTYGHGGYIGKRQGNRKMLFTALRDRLYNPTTTHDLP
jgi:hypothetical protein